MSELVAGMLNKVSLVATSDRLMVLRSSQPDHAVDQTLERVRGEYFLEGFRGSFRLRTSFEQLGISSQLKKLNLPTPTAYMAGMSSQLIDYIPNTEKLADLWLKKDDRALPATEKVLKALMQAHEAGVLPGDRSGKNELVTPEGDIHLIDFDLDLKGSDRTEFDMANFMYLVSRKVNNGQPEQIPEVTELYKEVLSSARGRRIYNPSVMLRYMKTFADLSTPQGVARLSTMTPIADPAPSREMFVFLGEVLGYEQKRTA